MKKISKLLASFLAVTQLSCHDSSILAAPVNSENITKQENKVFKYAKKAALLPLKGAWWFTKANLKALGIFTLDGIILSSIACYKIYNIAPEDIIFILKNMGLVLEGFKGQINKNYLQDFERILDKGYDKTTANEASRFFESHFRQIRCPYHIEFILNLTKFKNLVRNHEEQAQIKDSDASKPEFAPPESVPYLVLGSYGVSSKDEIVCLNSCMTKIRKNMRLNGNNVPDEENYWFRLLSNVADRRRFLEHCK